MPANGACRCPPWSFWLVPSLVAALRAIPFLITLIVVQPEGKVLPPVGYNPLDSFAYVAFVRQAAESGDWFLSNPYATIPQGGRYVLPLFSFLGRICHWTGLDPFWALELARISLLFVFFVVLWWFLEPFWPNTRQRLAATWLVGLSGGIEFVARFLVKAAPSWLQAVTYKALSDDLGWSTFAAFNNPLWVAAFTLVLIALRPLLRPIGPQRWRDWVTIAAAFIATYYVHPYSGLVVIAVVVLLPLVRWVLGVPGISLAYLKGAGAAMVPALVFVGAVSLWQNQDPVYRLTAQRVLGDDPRSVFWYPIALGGLGVLALRGWRQWLASQAPARVEVGAWTITVILMHTSPMTNGYHFVPYLHLPLCVVAAGVFVELLQRARDPNRGVRIRSILLTVILFQSALAVTWRSARQVLDYQVPAPIMTAIDRLGQEPAGTVYTSPHIGTLIPAYTRHRVYVGHWFLTPNYSTKQAQFMDWLEGRADPAALVELLHKERIDYLLLPPAMPTPVLEAVRPLAKSVVSAGPYVLLVLSD